MVKASGKTPSEGLDPRKAQRPAAPQLGAIQRFGDIDMNYMLAREQAWLAARRRFEAAERRHAEALAALQKDVQTKLGQAYQQGVDAWDAGRSDDSRNQYQDLIRQYMAATGTIYDEARARFEESLRALNKEVEDAGKELYEVSRSAYRDYLSSLQDAWRALDVDAVVEACAIAAATRPRM
jgi:Skp family chaperone for outer membrane proteins